MIKRRYFIRLQTNKDGEQLLWESGLYTTQSWFPVLDGLLKAARASFRKLHNLKPGVFVDVTAFYRVR